METFFNGLMHLGHGGMVLGVFAFPVYAIGFAVRLIRKRYDRLHHRSMLIFILVAICAWFSLINEFLTFSARSIQSEAKTNLGAIYTCQVAYMGEQGFYLGRQGDGAKVFDQLGWAPEGITRYAYFCGEGMVPAGREMAFAANAFRPGGTWPTNTPLPVATDNAFTCVAIGNIDRDAAVDVWSINDAKALANLHNDIFESSPGYGTMMDAIRDQIDQKGLYRLLAGLLTPFLVASLIRDAIENRRRIRRSLLEIQESETNQPSP